MDSTEVLLRIRKDTDTIKLGSSIIAEYNKNPESIIIVRAIGAGAVNQAIKGIIVSNNHFSQKGLCASILPSFTSVDSPDKIGTKVSAVELKLQINKVR